MCIYIYNIYIAFVIYFVFWLFLSFNLFAHFWCLYIDLSFSLFSVHIISVCVGDQGDSRPCIFLSRIFLFLSMHINKYIYILVIHSFSISLSVSLSLSVYTMRVHRSSRRQPTMPAEQAPTSVSGNHTPAHLMPPYHARARNCSQT